MYWGALSTRISEPGRKRPGFFFGTGGEGGISSADPVVGGGFADPVVEVLQRICKTFVVRTGLASLIPWRGGFRIFQHPCGEGGISFADPVEGGASLIPLRGGFRSRNPPMLRTGVFSFLELTEVNFARFENEKPAAFAAGFVFLAVRAGFEPAVHLRVRQFSKLVVSASHPPHLLLPNGLIRSPVKIMKILTGVQIYTDFGN